MKKLDTPLPNSSPRATRMPLLLYVEDNDDNWSVAEMRLSKTYRVLRAENDRRACELITQHAAELYVILMDIELQGSQLDGIALTRLLRGLPPHGPLPDYAKRVPVLATPVIFVTAYHTTLTPTLSAAGGNLVIPKPVEFLRLTRELTSMHLRTIGK